MSKKILITGGAGYIGSHVAVKLLEQNTEVVILDNLVNASENVIKKIEKITNKKVDFISGDIRDEKLLIDIFSDNALDGVMHFAGLKSVSESIDSPLEYYDVNVLGGMRLIKVMKENNVKKIVFSSSATIYGRVKKLPIKETDEKILPENTYGATKYIFEKILDDLYRSDETWRIAKLRYFNPVGAHRSGLLGENPKNTPNNLMPHVIRTAMGLTPKLKVYGGDYDTKDGTAIRDYIHIEDLARGHLHAYHKIDSAPQNFNVNLGCGKGYTVLEIIKVFEEENNVEIPYEIVPRRKGDIEASYADISLAEKIIGWKPTLNINDMCRDSWRWQRTNKKEIE